MASQGPFSPGTVTPDGGSTVWTNPNNVKVSDNTYASVALDAQDTEILRCTNFGFTIPTGSTITGILVEIQRKSDATGLITDAVVYLTKNGTAAESAENKATVTQWPASEAYESHGGATDLWTNTWTVAQINASTFGVFVGAEENNVNADTAYIDHIRITVYYTLPWVTNDGARVSNDQWHDRPVGVGNGMSVTGP